MYVEAEDLARSVGAVTEAVPDLALRVLVAAEQHLSRIASLACGNEDDDRLGFRKTGEVVEMAVRPIGIVRVGVADRLGCGGNRRETATALGAHLGDETRAALTVVIVGVLHRVRADGNGKAPL